MEYICMVNCFMDFIYKDNEFYLKKVLFGRIEYNYVICDKIRVLIFIELGFYYVYLI